MNTLRTPRWLLVFAVLALSLPAHAGLEQAYSASAAAFKSALELPAFVLLGRQTPISLSSDVDQLIELLEDNDPNIRVQAARALKGHAATNRRAESKLLETLDGRNELDAVRREILKSLAWAAQHPDTRKRILEIATNVRSETADMRAIAFKSLYIVSSQYEVRRELRAALDSAREELAVRAAAAWAMGLDSFNDSATRRALQEVAEDRNEETRLRVEAVKSLYSGLGDWSAKSAVNDLARDARLDDPLREAAILCLNAVNADWSVRSYLTDLSKGSESLVIRTAAIKALQAGPSLELARYFHLTRYQGSTLDPLEDQ